MTDAATEAQVAADERFLLSTSQGFESWLARSGGSFASTTYQAGKLFRVGRREDGRPWGLGFATSKIDRVISIEP